MIRTTLVCSAAAALWALPAIAAGQSAQAGPDPRPRPQPRVVVEQQREAIRERERERRSQDQRHEQTEKISKTFQVGRNGELVIANMSGDITVTRGRGNDIVIEATKVARARTEEDARRLLSFVTVNLAERGSRVEARATYSRGPEVPGQYRRNFSVSVVYNIIAPAGTRVTAETLAGDISVTGINGELSVSSTSGDVTVTDAEHLVLAKTVSGDVQVTNARSETPLETQAISGNVILRGVKAPRIEAMSVSGGVTFADVESTRVEAHSTTGDIEFNSPVARGGRYEFNSHSGTIRITVTGGGGFEFEASTFSGTIRADGSLGLKNAGGGQGRRPQRSLSGVVGDGNAVLEISTFSGDAVISKR